MSLSNRLVLIIAITVAVAMSLFFALTAWRLNETTDAQSSSIERQMEAKFSERLELEGRLAASFFTRLKESADASVSALAGRDETRSLIERGNIVAIDLTMQRAAKSYGLQSVIVLDRGATAIGSHRPGLNLLEVNSVFASVAMRKSLIDLLENNSREAPRSLRQFVTLPAETAAAIGMVKSAEKGASKFASVSVHPVFDEFGDVLALVVGYRLMSENNALLERFVQRRQLAVELMDGGSILMRAGRALKPQEAISACHRVGPNWNICVRSPRSVLTGEVNALVSALVSERDSLIRWVAVLSLLSLAFAAMCSSIAARAVMAPLANITRAVRSVAKGNWMKRVAGQKRRDEVGEIARAVAVLQQSVKEREQLQADVADVEELRAHRVALVSSLSECRSALRQHLFKMSNERERLETALDRLTATTGLAEGEADETRFVAMRLVQSASAVTQDKPVEAALVQDAIDRLCETIGTIAEESRDLSQDVDGFLGDVSALDRTIKSFLTEVDDHALKPAGVRQEDGRVTPLETTSQVAG